MLFFFGNPMLVCQPENRSHSGGPASSRLLSYRNRSNKRCLRDRESRKFQIIQLQFMMLQIQFSFDLCCAFDALSIRVRPLSSSQGSLCVRLSMAGIDRDSSRDSPSSILFGQIAIDVLANSANINSSTNLLFIKQPTN